jgi:hypothetical protein
MSKVQEPSDMGLGIEAIKVGGKEENGNYRPRKK